MVAARVKIIKIPTESVGRRECCLTVSKLGHANNTHIICLCDADILEELQSVSH